MTRRRMLVSALGLTGVGALWISSGSAAKDGPAGVVALIPVAAVSALALAWIGWEFAGERFTRRTAGWSINIGVFVLTPLISLLIDDNPDPTNTSVVALALAAGAAAAMGGAIWRVFELAGDAIHEWKLERAAQH